MEKMKTKIEKAAESINMSKSSYAYQTLTKKDFATNEKVRTCHTSGRGRFTKCLDYTDDFRRLLDAAGIAYEYGNDAPRGGKCGQYIVFK